MSKKIEVERKFLVKLPDIQMLDIRKKIEIDQIYLLRGKNDSQRRVRKLSENGVVSFTYTEKIFLTPLIRNEEEYEIDRTEYLNLLKQVDKSYSPVKKIRYYFNYHNQIFELDVYPFSQDLAIMEIEIDTTEQKIDFPDYVQVLKDVSEDKKYSNAEIASAKKFPE